MTYRFKKILLHEWWLILWRLMSNLEHNVLEVIPMEAGPILANDDGVGILGAM